MMGFPAFTYFLPRVGTGRLLLAQRCGVGYLLIFTQPFNTMRYALCAMRYALCAMRYALCAMRYALCVMLFYH
jgi:hypothetical protein